MFAIASDGDLEEGINHEAASLAGHLALDRLTVVYDDNRITIGRRSRVGHVRRHGRAFPFLRMAC